MGNHYGYIKQKRKELPVTFPEPSSRLGFINGLSNHKNISANREDTNGKNRKLQQILAIFVISCDCATWPDKYQI